MKIFFFILLISATSFAEELSFYDKHVGPTLERSKDEGAIHILAFGGMLAAAATSQDHYMHDKYSNNRQMTDTTSSYGNYYGTYAIGAAIGFIHYFIDEPNGTANLRGQVYSGLITTSIKAMGLRHRPNGSTSVRSFPSGHTSDAFSVATSFAYAYGWQAAVVVYPMAAFVGLTRMADDAHYFSDVVAGAVVGIFGARAAYHNVEAKKAWMILPIYQAGGEYGLAWNYRF